MSGSISNSELEKIKRQLQTAESLKKEGNVAYLSNSYKIAIRKYHHALMELKAVGSAKTVEELFSKRQRNLPSSINDELNKLQCACYNNLAGIQYRILIKNITFI